MTTRDIPIGDEILGIIGRRVEPSREEGEEKKASPTTFLPTKRLKAGVEWKMRKGKDDKMSKLLLQSKGESQIECIVMSHRVIY